MTADNRESRPDADAESDTDVPAANPAYSTPPPGGIPDADDD